jgi:hypothetical protein
MKLGMFTTGIYPRPGRRSRYRMTSLSVSGSIMRTSFERRYQKRTCRSDEAMNALLAHRAGTERALWELCGPEQRVGVSTPPSKPILQ